MGRALERDDPAALPLRCCGSMVNEHYVWCGQFEPPLTDAEIRRLREAIKRMDVVVLDGSQ